MAIAGRRTDPVRLSFRRLGMLVLALAVLFLASAVWDVFKKERDSHALRVQAETRLVELTEQRDHLAEEIARLETARGKEEALRAHYELGMPGEHLMIIVEPRHSEPLVAPAPVEAWSEPMIPVR